MTITFKRVYIRNYASLCNATTNSACEWDANAKERNQSKRKQLSKLLHKTLWNFSPIGIDCQNGQKSKKANINCGPPSIVYFSTSGMQCTYPTANTWRKTNYIDAQRLQQKDMPQGHNKERHKQSSSQNIPIEACNQRISIESTRPKILWATRCWEGKPVHVARLSSAPRLWCLLGNVLISKKFLRTRKIMVMHSNKRGECCPCTLVDRKRKR